MNYPVCLVDIYGRDEQWTLQAEIAPSKPYGETLSSDLVACQTEKHLHYGQPAGHFMLTLAHRLDSRGRSWAHRIRPQDLVVIQMQNYGQRPGAHGQGELHTVMIGLVDSIRFAGGVSDSGSPTRQIVVTGSDFGKLFQRGNVTYWSFMGASLVGAAEFILPHLLNAHPHTVVERLVQELFFKFMRPAWVFNNTNVAFEDVLGWALTSYQSLFPGGLDWQFLLSEEAFWSFFIKVASPPFHELYVDTRRVSSFVNHSTTHPLFRTEVVESDTEPFRDENGDVQLQAIRKFIPEGSQLRIPRQTYGADDSAPFLVMRPPPFPELSSNGSSVNTVPWTSLPEHVIDLEEAGYESQQQDIARSDAEIFNLYLVFPRGGAIGETQYLLNVPPLLDAKRFHHYGYRPLMPHTNLLNYPVAQTSTDPWLTFYADLQWKLAGWNVLNDHYWSGQLSYPLLPHVHVGERLTDQSTWVAEPGSKTTGKQFYIESVRHDFQAHHRAQTKVGVTRGLAIDEARVYDSMLLGLAGELTQVGFDVRQKYVDLIHKGQRVP